MVPVCEMTASTTTAPSTRAAFAILGYAGRIGARSIPCSGVQFRCTFSEECGRIMLDTCQAHLCYREESADKTHSLSDDVHHASQNITRRDRINRRNYVDP